MSEAPGIWLVRCEADAIGGVLHARFGGILYRPWQLDGNHRAQFAAAFRQHRLWVIVGAAGIAVRFLDGLTADKQTDPAVVVVDEAARHAIALLGGHEGGANALAYRVATALGATPVITTATEANKPLVAGIGCRRDVSATQIGDALMQALALAPAGRRLDEVREIATIDLKQDEPGLLAFCTAHGLPLRVIARASIAARAWVTRPSEWVMQNVGVEGVCEPCALIAAARGTLLVPKTTLDGVAVAIVEDQWSNA